jgi:excisionase family DNA binding protein
MEQLVPIEDVAKYFSVSLSTTRKWVRDGVIPENTYIKVGKTQRFALASIAEALLKGTASEEGAEETTVDDFDPTAFDPDEDV